MSRIPKVMPETASLELKQLHSALLKKMGGIPNIFLHMSHSPAVLQGFLLLLDQASKVSVAPQLQEKIALIIAQSNKCHYCLSAHTAFAKMQGLNEEAINLARQGSAENKKEEAILHFVKQVVEKRGHVSDADVEGVKKAGVSNQELVEIIFLIHLNMFTNYFNHIVDPEIDFPKPANLP